MRLEPLTESHLEDLCAVGLDAELWKWIPVKVENRDQMLGYIRDALKLQTAGTALPCVRA